MGGGVEGVRWKGGSMLVIPIRTLSRIDLLTIHEKSYFEGTYILPGLQKQYTEFLQDPVSSCILTKVRT